MTDNSAYQTQLLTAHAATDDLGPADYEAIYVELRQLRPLRDLVDLLASAYSIAWWSKYEHGDIRLTRAARNELRRAVNLPELPPAVAELIADPAVVSPDASVYRIDPRHSRADGNPVPATRVLLLGDQPAPITIHVNSTITVAPASDSPVTAVTRTTHHAPRKTVHLSLDISVRFQAARSDTDYNVNDFVAALLDHWNQP